MSSDEPGPAEGMETGSPELLTDPDDRPILAASDGPAEVAFVVPAPAYGAIATDEVDLGGLAESPSTLLAAFAEMGAALGKRLDGLSAAFDREIRAEATREKVVDRLHAELQEYKNDFLLDVLRPVFIDLIQLHDDIGKIVAARAEPSDDARLLELMRGFQQGIEDILYRQGVEPFSLEDDAFDPRRQRAFATVTTEDAALNKRVAARIRRGFRSGEKVIRPEIVTVHALKRGS